MDNMRCRVRQDQEPDIDEALSRQGVECIHEFGFKHSHLEYINELNRLPLPEDDWQYHVSVNHTANCENTEAIINR